MPFDFAYLAKRSPGIAAELNEDGFRDAIDKLVNIDRVTLRRLHAYYANPSRYGGVGDDDAGSTRPYRMAQEMGLPSRITGRRASDEPFGGTRVEPIARKEVVCENDVAWRVDTIIDYLFGKPIVISSQVSDPTRRAMIEAVVRQVFARHGGIAFFQQLALNGAIYGGVDVLVKLSDEPLPENEMGLTSLANAAANLHDLGAKPPGCETEIDTTGINDMPTPQADHPGDPEATDLPIETDTHAPATNESSSADAHRPSSTSSESGSTTASFDAAAASIARFIRLEVVEPARALPVFCGCDTEHVGAYAVVYEKPTKTKSTRTTSSVFARLKRLAGGLASARPEDANFTRVVELMTATSWQRYEDETLVGQGDSSLGLLPLVHIQNATRLNDYRGGGEVEPMIPMQDELNTRLSDRAYRITMQSFKMYLAKGVENFDQLNVGPGRMWATDNENADVIEFGGDGKTFSEDNHIAEVREALDKISGVTPIAAGVTRRRIGRLTSAAALRMTMLALVAKVERRRRTYGDAIGRIAALALAWLDHAGVFKTTADERTIDIHWPSPVPEDETERLREARSKVKLGVPREVVLRELGY